MTTKTSTASSNRASQADGSNFVVLLSMLLVSVSIALGLNIHLGMDLAIASVVGFSLFIGLAGFQVWQRSSFEIHALKEEIDFLDGELERLKVPTAPTSKDISAYKPTKIPIQTSFLEDKTPPPSGASISVVKENDVDAIQQRIKDMLTQVSSTEQSDIEREEEVPNSGSKILSLNEETKPQSSTSPEKSLGVLKNAMESLRSKPKTYPAQNPSDTHSSSAFEAPIPPLESTPPSSKVDIPTGVSQDASEELSAAPAVPDVSLVQQAVASGRVDVFLEPILSIGEHSAKHYEVSICLRGPSNEDLGPLETEILRGRGVLPLVDTACFQRSALIAERLGSQGRDGCVFTRSSGVTLLDPSFNQVIEKDFVGHQSVFRQMVLCLTQSDIRSFRADEQRAVAKFSSLGFRFAVLGITDFDMNFEAMSRAGFSFARLGTRDLISGLSNSSGKISAPQIAGYLAQRNFTLIVDGIDSEETLARIYEYGALFGQGPLFGGRRPVKADLISRSAQAAA